MILGAFWKFFHPSGYSLTSRTQYKAVSSAPGTVWVHGTHQFCELPQFDSCQVPLSQNQIVVTYGGASIRCYLFMHPCLTICLKSIETAEDALSMRGRHAALHRSSPHDAWLCLSLQPSNAQVEWHYLAESLPPSRNKCKETACGRALVHLQHIWTRGCMPIQHCEDGVSSCMQHWNNPKVSSPVIGKPHSQH